MEEAMQNGHRIDEIDKACEAHMLGTAIGHRTLRWGLDLLALMHVGQEGVDELHRTFTR